MAKLHMRYSIELDVPDDLFREIVDKANEVNRGCGDVEYFQLPAEVRAMIDTKRFEVSDWDEGGYAPGSWIEADAENSGMYECDEHGIRRKENA